jgi:hypothetical protein
MIHIQLYMGMIVINMLLGWDGLDGDKVRTLGWFIACVLWPLTWSAIIIAIFCEHRRKRRLEREALRLAAKLSAFKARRFNSETCEWESVKNVKHAKIDKTKTDE